LGKQLLMNVRLILNPGSRSGRGLRLWKIWDARLQAARCGVERVQTESLEHARELARTSCGVDAVVAVGGDGTINAVLDGILQSGNPDLALGVLYSGTSPDFCRFHGIPLEPAAAVEALLGGRRRRVDVARITFSDDTGASVTAHFGSGCNIGMGAAIARTANRVRRYIGDVPGTGLAVVKALCCVAPKTLVVECDGVSHVLPHTNNLSILKNPFLASGLKLDIGARPDDGLLYAVAIGGQKPFQLLRALPGFYTGRAVRDRAVWMQTCRRIVVRGASSELEYDGDPHGHLPATVEILPRALNLLGGRSL
jgi:diacylglycerol kinase family enzyme